MMGYRKKYTVEYLDAGQIVRSWESKEPVSLEQMKRGFVGEGDPAYVMRWFSHAKRFRVFSMSYNVTVRIGIPASQWRVLSGSTTVTMGIAPAEVKEPKKAWVFEHEDREACIMWTAMKGDG